MIEKYTIKPVETLPIPTKRKYSLYRNIVEKFALSSANIAKVTIEGRTSKNTIQGLRRFTDNHIDINIIQRNNEPYLIKEAYLIRES